MHAATTGTRRQFLTSLAAVPAATMAAALLSACGSAATTASSGTATSAAPALSTSSVAATSTAVTSAAATTTAARTTTAAASTTAASAPVVSASASTPAAHAAPAQQAASLRVWWGTAPTQQGVTTDFQKAFPTVKVQLSLLGENVYGNPKYLAAVAANTGPDVAYQNRHTFHEFSSQGLYKDLTPIFLQDGFTQHDIGPEQWKELTWSGKLYGIPYQVDGRFFFWNTQHFAEAGLDPTKGPKTWTDIETFASKLTRKSGNTYDRYGFIPGFPSGLSDQLLIFGLETGAKTYDPAGKKVLLDSDPAWADALTWVANFYNVYDGGGKQAAQWLSGFASQTVDPFAQGKVSMTSYGLWMVGGYAAYPNLKYNGSFAMPVADNLAGTNVNWSCDYSFVMDPHTKYVDQSWQFIKFVTGQPGMESLATTGLNLTKQQWQREKLPGTPVYIPEPVGLLPVNTWLKNSPYLTKLPEPQKTMALSGFDGLSYATGCGNLGWLVAAELWNGFKNAWDMVVTGQKSPKDALYAVTPPIQTALDKAWQRIESQQK